MEYETIIEIGTQFQGTAIRKGELGAKNNKIIIEIPVYARDTDIPEIIRIINHETLHLLAGNSERLVEAMNQEIWW